MKGRHYEEAVFDVLDYIRGFTSDEIDLFSEAEAIVAAALVCRFVRDDCYLGVLPKQSCKFRVPIEVLIPPFDPNTIPEHIFRMINQRRRMFDKGLPQ